MTVLHKDEPVSMKGVYPESHNCIDCGYNTAPGLPPRELAEFLMDRDGSFPMTFTDESEIYAVRNSVWKKAGIEPYGGCLCVGCLERRIGRRLKSDDFPDHPLNNPAIPCTERLRDGATGRRDCWGGKGDDSSPAKILALLAGPLWHVPACLRAD